MEKANPNAERFEFVADCVAHAVNRSDSAHSELLKWSLQMDLQRIIDQKYELAISSLCQSVCETQSIAAYLLLVEAYARAGQMDMALLTLDVLQYLEPDMPEASLLKGLILQEKGDYAEARNCIQMTIKAKPSVLLAWKALIDISLDQEDPYEAARLLNEALQHHSCDRYLMGIQSDLKEMFPEQFLDRHLPRYVAFFAPAASEP